MPNTVPEEIVWLVGRFYLLYFPTQLRSESENSPVNVSVSLSFPPAPRASLVKDDWRAWLPRKKKKAQVFFHMAGPRTRNPSYAIAERVA